MTEATERRGFWQVMFGPDTLQKAGYYRVAGIVFTIAFAFLVLGSALLLKNVPLLIFIGLGLGGFCTFVSSEIRRRVQIETALRDLRSDLNAVQEWIRNHPTQSSTEAGPRDG